MAGLNTLNSGSDSLYNINKRMVLGAADLPRFGSDRRRRADTPISFSYQAFVTWLPRSTPIQPRVISVRMPALTVRHAG